jgi:NAD(P)-dependent dehydrogenase (short-subunit alcohol dehydrogenase family)
MVAVGEGSGMRLADKTAMVMGAGQTPGETIGNGRATALLFAREGARVFLVDRDLDSARETQSLIEGEGGRATAFAADITKEADCRDCAAACVAAYRRIDVLHNNVGILTRDGPTTELAEADWDRILAVNLKGMFLACKHVLPVMRDQGAGAIVNISSTAALWSGNGFLAYNTSKAGVNALTCNLALENAPYGIRANAIMPGLMNTPMAIEGLSAQLGVAKAELIAERDAQVPLGGKMGTAWDVARAALFLASDEARYITGAILPVDGGRFLRRG